MVRLFSLGQLALIVLVSIVLLTGSSYPAFAGTPTPPAASAVNWGVNANGWQVTVQNQSSVEVIDFFPASLTTNIKSMPDSIPAGGQGTVQGVESILGGPANMDFYYYGCPHTCALLHASIRSYSNGSYYVDCHRCRVSSQSDPSKPVVVTFDDSDLSS